MASTDQADHPATVVSIETGNAPQGAFIVFRFQTLTPGQKTPDLSPWYAIPPDGAKSLQAHLSAELGRMATPTTGTAPKPH